MAADDTSQVGIEGQVRRADPDRWLAARFVADEAARADLLALYALNDEIARAPAVASQPIVGQIRLTWWREAIEEIAAGKPVRAHPGVQALALAMSRRTLPPAALIDLVEARLRDLDGWPLGEVEVEAYVDATAGRLMMLAALLLDPAADPHTVRGAARAWGIAGLARTGGRLPAGFDAVAAVEAAVVVSRTELRSLPVAAFPAAAYATLARGYVRGRTPGDFERQARMTLAVARGRI